MRCAAHHVAAPVQITLRRALSTAMISLLSLISRAAFSERSDECDNCGNFLSGEARVPASRETIVYANGSRGGFFDLSAFVASSVRDHLDMDKRRAYGIVGVDELELVVSEMRGESSAESEAGIASRRGRSISMRWGSSETDKLLGGGGPLIERASLREGTTSIVILLGGGGGTRNALWPPLTHARSTRSCFTHFFLFQPKIRQSFLSCGILSTTFLVNSCRTNPSGHLVKVPPFPNPTN